MKPAVGEVWLKVGGVCRAGHPIKSEDDIVYHGQAHRARCRVCVREAHRAWVARGRKAKS